MIWLNGFLREMKIVIRILLPKMFLYVILPLECGPLCERCSKLISRAKRALEIAKLRFPIVSFSLLDRDEGAAKMTRM